MQQNDFMAFLYFISEDDDFTVNAYADAEERGLIGRDSDKNKTTSIEYAQRLLFDGKDKGWLLKKTTELKKRFPSRL